MPALRPLLLLFALIIALVDARPAQAHPHVSVDTVTEIMFDKDGQITGVRHIWVFDEFYSAYAVQGLDANKDGQYTREELQELANTNTEGLREFDFFTSAKDDRRTISFDNPKDQFLTFDGKKLTLNFVLPVKEPFRPGDRTLTVAVYDPTYFVAFAPAAGEPVKLLSAPATCKVDYQPPQGTGAATNLSESFFQNMQPGSDFAAKFAGKIAVTCK